MQFDAPLPPYLGTKEYTLLLQKQNVRVKHSKKGQDIILWYEKMYEMLQC